MTNREKFLLECVGMNEHELENVLAAYVFAKNGHYKQMRDCGKLRYFEHPRAVALIIIRELKLSSDWELVVTALLHDIVEDTFLFTRHRLVLNFGENVAEWVMLLTKEQGIDYHARLHACGIWQVLLVKLADRLHNLRSLNGTKPEKREKCQEETHRLFIPLANKLEKIIPEDLKDRARYLGEEIRQNLM